MTLNNQLERASCQSSFPDGLKESVDALDRLEPIETRVTWRTFEKTARPTLLFGFACPRNLLRVSEGFSNNRDDDTEREEEVCDGCHFRSN